MSVVTVLFGEGYVKTQDVVSTLFLVFWGDVMTYGYGKGLGLTGIGGGFDRSVRFWVGTKNCFKR